MKIKGIPVGTSMPRPDWAQTDPRKANYIHNKPSFEAKQNRLAWVTDEDVDAMFEGTYEGVDKETYIDDDLVVDTLYAMEDVVVAGKSLKDLSIGSGGGGSSGGTGSDGFSPIAKVTQTAEGAIIEITDKDGTTTATVTNGKDGAPGKDYVLTEADKEEIAGMVPGGEVPPTDELVQAVIDALPVYDGSYTEYEIYDGSYTKGAIE
jgi:hypothetical protein